jgi:hypothetical protein
MSKQGHGLHKVRAGIHKHLPNTASQTFAPVQPGEQYRVNDHPYWRDLVGKVGVVVRPLPYNQMVLLEIDGNFYDIHFTNLVRVTA